MNIVELNILDVDGPAVICHQVNCQGVMGGGLALQIRKRHPWVYERYIAKKDWRLGDCQIVEISNGDSQFVANLAGQEGFGRESVQTDYPYLAMALRTARDFADANELNLYLPYMMGCGLAGGDWARVTALIEEFAPNAVVCKLPEGS
jgi:O-acetyl-ADP-ribose deacetylase (regulator of RNase III)